MKMSDVLLGCERIVLRLARLWGSTSAIGGIDVNCVTSSHAADFCTFLAERLFGFRSGGGLVEGCISWRPYRSGLRNLHLFLSGSFAVLSAHQPYPPTFLCPSISYSLCIPPLLLNTQTLNCFPQGFVSLKCCVKKSSCRLRVCFQRCPKKFQPRPHPISGSLASSQLSNAIIWNGNPTKTKSEAYTWSKTKHSRIRCSISNKSTASAGGECEILKV